jgi:hypothetical protein
MINYTDEEVNKAIKSSLLIVKEDIEDLAKNGDFTVFGIETLIEKLQEIFTGVIAISTLVSLSTTNKDAVMKAADKVIKEEKK